MKHKNVKVGQHVIIKRSTSETWHRAADHIGEEFRVVEVEPMDYCGGNTEDCATVLVRSVIEEGPLLAKFWCNHRDLRLVKEAPKLAERPFKVGDKVRVINNPDDLFPVGTVGTISRDDGVDDELPFRVYSSDGSWFYHERDLELYVEEGAPGRPDIGALFVVTDRTMPSHCFADGVVVRCAEVPRHGNCRYEDKNGIRQYVSPSDLKPLSLADIQAALAK